MRKPHQHECDGKRFDCANVECRMPFKVTRTAPRPRRTIKVRERVASHEVQHARYLDCGPQNWDDRDGGQ